jgi:hypothetical protein
MVNVRNAQRKAVNIRKAVNVRKAADVKDP